MSDTQTPNRSTSSLPGAALLTAGIAAASLLAAKPAAAKLAPRAGHTQVTSLTLSQLPGGGSDVQILNYALALEQLEADLYRQAYARLTDGTNFTDKTPATSGIGTPILGLQLPATNASVQYLGVFAKVEAAHRDFLTAALTAATGGTTNVVKPFLYDFGLDTMTELQVVQLIYAVEGTGVQAYLGAIPHFVTTTYLQTAASIQATEARHTAATAIVLNTLGVSPKVETAPLATENNGIDGHLEPDAVLATVTGNGWVYSS